MSNIVVNSRRRAIFHRYVMQQLYIELTIYDYHTTIEHHRTVVCLAIFVESRVTFVWTSDDLACQGQLYNTYYMSMLLRKPLPDLRQSPVTAPLNWKDNKLCIVCERGFSHWNTGLDIKASEWSNIIWVLNALHGLYYF